MRKDTLEPCRGGVRGLELGIKEERTTVQDTSNKDFPCQEALPISFKVFCYEIRVIQSAEQSRKKFWQAGCRVKDKNCVQMTLGNRGTRGEGKPWVWVRREDGGEQGSVLQTTGYGQILVYDTQEKGHSHQPAGQWTVGEVYQSERDAREQVSQPSSGSNLQFYFWLNFKQGARQW